MSRARRVGIVVLCLAVVLGAATCKKKGEEPAGGGGAPAATPATTPATTSTTPAAAPTEPLTAPIAAPEPGTPVLSPVMLKTAATVDETKAATELATKLADPVQVGAETERAENARLFVILAAGSGTVAEVAAALTGMVNTWKDDADDAAKAEYVAVITARLAEKEHEVLAPALRAAAEAIDATDPVDEALAKALFAVLSRADDPAAQYVALEVLRGGKKVLELPGAKDAFLAAFGSEHPHVASQALVKFAWLVGTEVPAADASAYRAKIEELLKHADPAVRGEACGALAEFVPYGDQEAAVPVAKLLLPLLDDAHPFVKSSAAGALASIKYKPAIHAFMNHLEDKAENTYDTPAWTTILGVEGWDHHDPSAWDRVDGAMLGALATMTYFDDAKFEYDVSTSSVDADLAKAVEAARAWYEQHKAEIPALE